MFSRNNSDSEEEALRWVLPTDCRKTKVKPHTGFKIYIIKGSRYQHHLQNKAVSEERHGKHIPFSKTQHRSTGASRLDGITLGLMATVYTVKSTCCHHRLLFSISRHCEDRPCCCPHSSHISIPSSAPPHPQPPTGVLLPRLTLDWHPYAEIFNFAYVAEEPWVVTGQVFACKWEVFWSMTDLE